MIHCVNSGDGGRVSAVAIAATVYITVLAVGAMQTVVYNSSLNRRATSMRRDMELLLRAARWLFEEVHDLEVGNRRRRITLRGPGGRGESIRIDIQQTEAPELPGGRLLTAFVLAEETGRTIGEIRGVLMPTGRSLDRVRVHIVGVSCYRLPAGGAREEEAWVIQ